MPIYKTACWKIKIILFYNFNEQNYILGTGPELGFDLHFDVFWRLLSENIVDIVNLLHLLMSICNNVTNILKMC